jgi:hypothetical protein
MSRPFADDLDVLSLVYSGAYKKAAHRKLASLSFLSSLTALLIILCGVSANREADWVLKQSKGGFVSVCALRLC